jgi:hypothetical protein
MVRGRRDRCSRAAAYVAQSQGEGTHKEAPQPPAGPAHQGASDAGVEDVCGLRDLAVWHSLVDLRRQGEARAARRGGQTLDGGASAAAEARGEGARASVGSAFVAPRDAGNGRRHGLPQNDRSGLRRLTLSTSLPTRATRAEVMSDRATSKIAPDRARTLRSYTFSQSEMDPLPLIRMERGTPNQHQSPLVLVAFAGSNGLGEGGQRTCTLYVYTNICMYMCEYIYVHEGLG